MKSLNQLANVAALEVNDVPVKRTESAREVGIKFDKRVKQNAFLVR